MGKNLQLKILTLGKDLEAAAVAPVVLSAADYPAASSLKSNERKELV